MTEPYGQGIGWVDDLWMGGWTTAPPRRRAWGQAETSAEWPRGCVVLLSNRNVFYTAPPPGGIKISRRDIDFTATPLEAHRVVVIESRFTESYRSSRWVSIAFEFMGQRVWTNVVREPCVHRDYRADTHYVNNHTQWGYRDMTEHAHRSRSPTGRSRSRSWDDVGHWD